MDIDEIFRRAQEASNRASADLEKSIQKSAEIARQASEETELEKKQNEDAKKAAEQEAAYHALIYLRREDAGKIL